MLLPALLPKKLFLYAEANDDSELIQMLIKTPNQLVTFFEHACEDKTWSEHHLSFMQAAMESLTFQFRQERLAFEFAHRIAKAFQSNYPLLRSCLKRDIILHGHNGDVEANSLLIAVSSEFFYDLIRMHYSEGSKLKIDLNKVPMELLAHVEEYVSSGDIPDLWKQEQSTILNLLNISTTFRIKGLIELCEETLRRYINKNNALDFLVMSHQMSWVNLRNSCFRFLNQQRLGVRFEEVEKYRTLDLEGRKLLALEFLEFSETSLDIFSQLKHLITHLICGGDLTEEASFSTVIRSCPHLISVDISRSRAFNERLYDLPASLQELDLSKCPWLTNDQLKKMIVICPNVVRLSLNSNVQLTYQGWGGLKNLKQLKGLDIARCHQVHDADFLLILNACAQITEIGLEECTGIGENGFFELARLLTRLSFLNVSRTHITDAQLIEIVTRCRHLRILNLTRCKGITDKGILQVIKQAGALQSINLTACDVTQGTVDFIRGLRPQLDLRD